MDEKISISDIYLLKAGLISAIIDYNVSVHLHTQCKHIKCKFGCL